jgi:alpha-glucosidase
VTLFQTSSDPAHRDRDWWRGAAIYQIYPRSFADADGIGIGDRPGIIARLDYIASLGVDAIRLTPFFPSPMDNFGYDVSEYRDVDPAFGTLADFCGRLQGSTVHLGGLDAFFGWRKLDAR